MPKHSETGNVKKLCDCKKQWTCTHPWYMDFKAPKDHPTRPDERYRVNLDKMIGRHAADLNEAKTEARRAIVAWLDGRDPRELQPADRPTLAQVIDAYQQRPNASTSRNVPYQIATISGTKVQGKPFGQWRVESITREALDDFRQQRPLIAGNRDLTFLRAMFNWAVARGLMAGTPFRVGDVPVVRLARETPRSRRLQGDEDGRLLEAANSLRPMIVAALETGCRLGELLTLQWSQIRFSPRAEIFLPATKTRPRRTGGYLSPAPSGRS